jgi:hypothetical protein
LARGVVACDVLGGCEPVAGGRDALLEEPEAQRGVTVVGMAIGAEVDHAMNALWSARTVEVHHVLLGERVNDVVLVGRHRGDGLGGPASDIEVVLALVVLQFRAREVLDESFAAAYGGDADAAAEVEDVLPVVERVAGVVGCVAVEFERCAGVVVHRERCRKQSACAEHETHRHA